jgi:hypothetical protein
MPLVASGFRFDLAAGSGHNPVLMPALLRQRLRRYWPVAATLLTGFALSGGLGWELHREAEELDRRRLALRVKETLDQLDIRPTPASRGAGCRRAALRGAGGATDANRPRRAG